MAADDDVDGGSGGTLKLLLNPHHHATHITWMFFFFFKALVVAVGVVHVFVWIDNIYSVPPQRKDEKMEKRWHRAVSFPCLDLSNTQQRAICHLTDELTLAVQIYGLLGTVISRVHKTLLNML